MTKEVPPLEAPLPLELPVGPEQSNMLYIIAVFLQSSLLGFVQVKVTSRITVNFHRSFSGKFAVDGLSMHDVPSNMFDGIFCNDHDES